MAMLGSFFKPGKRLMQHMRMTAKFSLIGACLVIPLWMLLYLYVSKANEDIEFAETELQGVAYHRLVNPLSNSTLHHRGQALLRLIELEDKAETEAVAAKVANDMALFARELEKDDPFNLRPLLAKVDADWKAAKAAEYKTTLEITAKYTEVAKSIMLVRRQISEQSQLSLDPDVDSYYLMVAATEKLPQLTEHLAPLRGLVAFAAAKPDLVTPTRIRAAGYMSLIRQEGDETADALKRVNQAAPAIFKKIDSSALDKTNAYLGTITRTIMDEIATEPKVIYNAGTQTIGAAAAMNVQTLDALEQALNDRISRLALHRNLMLGGVILGLLLAAYALVSFFLAAQSGFKGIGKRVDQLGKGDLRSTSRSTGTDEISDSINKFRHSVQSLGDIVRGVRESAEQISLASSEIAAGNNDLADRGARIANTVQETSDSMSSLAAKVEGNLAHANRANQQVQIAYGTAEEGQKVVQQAVGMMEKITASSRRIGDITEIIDGIAFQTNILALNAAVEAARAGEQGRGFAVVAAEVRNLAQRSAGAAKEINELIRTSIENVEDGSRHVNDAGHKMDDILSSVRSVNEIMADIGRASNEQAAEINVIAGAVREVDASTQQNAAMVEEIAAAVMSLEERARFLSDSVRAFQIDDASVIGTGSIRRQGYSAPVSNQQSANEEVEIQPPVRQISGY